jgi:hypothetical protein
MIHLIYEWFKKESATFVKTSKSPHAILNINDERRKWSFGSKTNAKNIWGLLKVSINDCLVKPALEKNFTVPLF